MTVEKFEYLVKKTIIVGIRFDGHAKELLNWALMKIAGRGDSVFAIHVCRNSGCFSNERALLDGYLEESQVLSNEKQVALSGDVLKGNSIRKVLVREAKNYSASAVIVGITKLSAFGGWASVAKYCTKRLPPTTEVIAIYNGKVVFSSTSNLQLEGPVKDQEHNPYLTENFMSKDNHSSEFGESNKFEMSRFSFNGKGPCISSREEIPNPVRKHKRHFSTSISLPIEDFTKQKPGWPLLQTASSKTQPSHHDARKMSVVQWVMSLPRRSLSLSEVPEFNSHTCEDEGFRERENWKIAEISARKDKVAVRKELMQKDLELILMKNSAGCEVFSYDVLKMSTCEFSSGNLIGKGGCNNVYKGILSEGKPVAVKVLRSSKESFKDFMQEIDIMTTLKHKRITPLLGICIKDNMLISVYEFLRKGSLEQNLHSNNRKLNSVLSWEARFQIAVGIAEALHYLHNECPKPIIHRDVKSSNILLTEELEPQLCDFGLAIWGPTAVSFLMDSDVVGTFGYLAPEYFMYGKISDKIDVYAFGVVLLELLSGRKAIGLETTKGQESIVMWAKPKLESGDLKSILDPSLDGNVDEAQMQRTGLAAKLCLTQAARLRPKMDKILKILNGEEHHEGGVKPECGIYEDDNDDEVYPVSHAESHLSVAFLDVNDNSTSFSSLDQSSPFSVEEYLKKRWSRSSSLE